MPSLPLQPKTEMATNAWRGESVNLLVVFVGKVFNSCGDGDQIIQVVIT